MMKNNNLCSGQSMFEILFAFAIMAIIVVAIVGMATISIRNSSYSRNKTLAEKNAQEASEWLREQRDTSWIIFLSHAGDTQKTYCMVTPDNSVWNNPEVCEDGENIAGTALYREIGLTKVDNKNISVEVSVYWSDSKGLHESNLSTTLGNWKPEVQ